MIIKDKEWKKLNNNLSKSKEQIHLLKAKHEEEIQKLNLQIEELKKSKKPDEIVIDIYGQQNNRGHWVKYNEIQFTKSTINLSTGVKWQVLKIFKKVLSQLNKHFDDEIKTMEIEYSELQKHYYLDKNKILKMPYFVTKKRVLKELFIEK